MVECMCERACIDPIIIACMHACMHIQLKRFVVQYYSGRHFVAATRHPELVNPVTGFVNMIRVMKFFPHMTQNYVSMAVNPILVTSVYERHLCPCPAFLHLD